MMDKEAAKEKGAEEEDEELALVTEAEAVGDAFGMEEEEEEDKFEAVVDAFGMEEEEDVFGHELFSEHHQDDNPPQDCLPKE